MSSVTDMSSMFSYADLCNQPCSTLDFDFRCDVGKATGCPLGSDCFDCDPMQRDLYCVDCIKAGGHYCEISIGRPICSSPEIAKQIPKACSEDGGTEYYSACPPFNLSKCLLSDILFRY